MNEYPILTREALDEHDRELVSRVLKYIASCIKSSDLIAEAYKDDVIEEIERSVRV